MKQMHLFRWGYVRQWICRLIILLMVVPSPNAFATEIQLDPSQPGDTSLDRAQNGVDVVNISRPTDAGLSNNKFRVYDISDRGAVLNNSIEVGVSTLAGAMADNPNFRGRSAATILLQVSCESRSTIAGPQEIFGDRARYVLVNPYGITLDGASVLNASQVTFSTGTPVLSGGALSGFNVSQGNILITGQGVNFQGIRRVDLLGRTAEIQAQLLGGDDLAVIVGQHYVDYALRTVTPRTETVGGEAPVWGIDASGLAPIVAGKITLLSTEAGVGIRTRQDMAAVLSDVVISAQGDIDVASVLAKEKVVLNGEDTITVRDAVKGQRIDVDGDALLNDGELSAGDHLDMTVDTLQNQGEILSDGSIVMQAGDSISNQGNIKGRGAVFLSSTIVENDADAVLLSSTSLHLNADQLTNNGDIVGLQELSAEIGDGVNRGVLYSDKQLALEVGSRPNDDVDVTAGTLQNQGEIISDGAMDIHVNGSFTNQGNVEGSGAVQLSSTTLSNDADAVLLSNASLYVDADQLTNDGDIVGLEEFTADIEDGVNRGVMYSDNRLALNVGSFTNHRGLILSQGTLAILNLSDHVLGSFTNHAGTVESVGDMTLSLGYLENTRDDVRRVSELG